MEKTMSKKSLGGIALAVVALIALLIAVPIMGQQETYGEVEIVDAKPDSPEVVATMAAQTKEQLADVLANSKEIVYRDFRSITIAGVEIALPDYVTVGGPTIFMGCRPDATCPANGSLRLDYADPAWSVSKKGDPKIIHAVYVDPATGVLLAGDYDNALGLNDAIAQKSQWLVDAISAATGNQAVIIDANTEKAAK